MSTPPARSILPDLIPVDSQTDAVSCDGGGGALGHPVVWYNFDDRDRVKCLYCDRVFIKQAPRS